MTFIIAQKDCNLILLPSLGREPSISSDTRTDSSTDSYPYKQAHHESLVSHFSSDSQGTVIYNVENDAASQSSRDTGSRYHCICVITVIKYDDCSGVQ